MQLRTGIDMLDPELDAKLKEEVMLNNQECLLLFQSKEEEKDFFFVTGRIGLINLLNGMLEEGNIDIDNSYVMSDATKLSERMTVREFIIAVNEDPISGQPDISIRDDDEDEE